MNAYRKGGERMVELSLMVWLFAATGLAAEDASPGLRVGRGEDAAVEVRWGGRLMLRLPTEGLWSVATDWRDGV